jgi:hypothetical protein
MVGYAIHAEQHVWLQWLELDDRCREALDPKPEVLLAGDELAVPGEKPNHDNAVLIRGTANDLTGHTPSARSPGLAWDKCRSFSIGHLALAASGLATRSGPRG